MLASYVYLVDLTILYIASYLPYIIDGKNDEHEKVELCHGSSECLTTQIKNQDDGMNDYLANIFIAP